MEELIKQLEQLVQQSITETEQSPQKLFERAIWTVENIDKVARKTTEVRGFPVSEKRLETAKIDILNSLVSQVSEVWETINDGSEVEELGERAINLACDELDKLNALQ